MYITLAPYNWMCSVLVNPLLMLLCPTDMMRQRCAQPTLVCTPAYANIHMYVCAQRCVFSCACAYLHMHVHISVHTRVHTHLLRGVGTRGVRGVHTYSCEYINVYTCILWCTFFSLLLRSHVIQPNHPPLYSLCIGSVCWCMQMLLTHCRTADKVIITLLYDCLLHLMRDIFQAPDPRLFFEGQ